MTNLVEALAAELERPRELSARVVNYIVNNYEVDYDAIGAFLVEELPKLEDYELDLILSPVFTPKLEDQAIFAEKLEAESISRDRWPGLIEQLVARPTRAQLVTSDRRTHRVPLREVTIERYVHRLRLDGSIAASLLKLAGTALLKAVARRAIWETEARRDILIRHLQSPSTAERPADLLLLLDLVEGLKPASTADLLAYIPRRQEILREQINAGGGKPFFSERVEELHGGGRDQRSHEHDGLASKESELAFLERLKKTLTD